MHKNILKIRVILWLFLGGALFCFAYLKIAPNGKISYVYDFSKPSYFIGKLSPAERVVINGAAEIVGDPVYFSLRPPRRFEKAVVTVKFKNTTDFPVMEIGLLNDKVAWGYDLKPLQNKIIDALSLVWPVVENPAGTRLIEREKKYDTIENFLNGISVGGQTDKIALYDYNFKTKFLFPGYQPEAENKTFDCGWRGSYQFYTYVKNEDLGYLFSFIDLNLNKDSDPVEIKVYSQDGLIYNKRLDDGGVGGPERQAGFKIPGLAEGVYRLSFIASDDIITKSITTPQSRLAIINKVWLAPNSGGNKILYTNSRRIGAQTINPGSLGEIKVNSEILNLSQTYKQFFLKTKQSPLNLTVAGNGSDRGPAGGLAKIETYKDDIIISGDGVFSFWPGGFMEPRFKNVDANLDINGEKINYILTDYQTPEESGGWLTAAAEFDLTKAYQENGKYQFLISLPGLASGGASGGALAIKEIKIELQGTSLIKKLKKIF